MSETSFPLFQWSQFSPDKSEQYVVRTDDWVLLNESVSKIKGLLPQTKTFPNDSGHMATSEEHVTDDVPVCPKHDKPMTPSKFGGYYCQTKDDSTPKGYCTYKIK